jgi:hypothetical protein
MRSRHGDARARKAIEPVPRGRARAEALAAIAAEARRRILATESLLDSITPEELEEYRADPLPEILGYGPQFVRKSPPRNDE